MDKILEGLRVGGRRKKSQLLEEKKKSITQGHYLLFHVQDQLNDKTDACSTSKTKRCLFISLVFLGQKLNEDSHHMSLLEGIKILRE